MNTTATLSAPTQAEADVIAAELATAALVVVDKQTEIITEAPPPPYSTALLLADATERLGWEAERVMATAQVLFEGIELDGIHTGLITYHRTDSLRTAPEAIAEARQVIARLYGNAALPKQPWQHEEERGERVEGRGPDTGTARPEKGQGAGWLESLLTRLRRRQPAPPQPQEAHEAIRPTSAARIPDKLAGKLDADGLALYELVWQRFIASQMKAARYRVIYVTLETP